MDNVSEVLEVATTAGRILLENGAETSRVEDIMDRISRHYGVDSGHFFVLSNGIFTSGESQDAGGAAGDRMRTYAKVQFIPNKSMQFAKVIAINNLSYDIAAGKYTLEEVARQLEHIRNLPSKPIWERLLASALGAGTFCAVFGGGFVECLASFVVGLLSAFFSIFVSSRYLSKTVATLADSFVMSLLCIVFFRIGFGSSLSNVIIGAVMLLVPGLPFVNGVRDLANSDYLAGMTRMAEALFTFLFIAIGVTASFMLDGLLAGGIINLGGVVIDSATSGYALQALAAGIATMSFAVLFGVPRDKYLACGVIGCIGWTLYLLQCRALGISMPVASAVASVAICVMARFTAVRFKSPATIYLLCGLIALVPGAGIFWCTYYFTASMPLQALSAGFNAIQVAISIVLGIVLAMELPQRIFRRRQR